MRRLAAFAFLLLFTATAWASLSFPPLTGRVVDDAHILSAGAVAQMDNMLAAHEQQTTDQIVVATVSSLQGTSIEDYGYQLGRFWGIGQKDKNNGALLIVAPNERKVRIEVGYGLEDRLTDAECTNIIDGVILPKFRAGMMQQGIVDGAGAILAVLGGPSAAGSMATQNQQPALHLTQQQIAHFTNSQPQLFWIGFFILGICVIAFIMTLADRPKPPAGFCFICDFFSNIFLILFMFLSRGGGGSSRSDGGGGGFSGGGGSFGGGGASGGW